MCSSIVKCTQHKKCSALLKNSERKRKKFLYAYPVLFQRKGEKTPQQHQRRQLKQYRFKMKRRKTQCMSASDAAFFC